MLREGFACKSVEEKPSLVLTRGICKLFYNRSLADTSVPGCQVGCLDEEEREGQRVEGKRGNREYEGGRGGWMGVKGATVSEDEGGSSVVLLANQEQGSQAGLTVRL